MIDYIYGSLDDSVVPVEYNGSETQTASTKVDNGKRVISVDVVKVPNTLTITSGNSEVVYDGSSNQSINIDSGSDYSAGEGITISDNAISIDSEVVATKEDVASVRTYKTFNDGWNVSGTTLEFCQSIEADVLAPEGTAYLGTLRCNDLPNGMGQAEAIVDIISNGANGKCIDITLTSLEVAPYRWTYSYGTVNGSVVTVGWKGNQEELVSGTNIKTINGSSVLGSGDISVGGSLYQHTITIKNVLSNCYCIATIMNTSSTAFSSPDMVYNFLFNNGFTSSSLLYPCCSNWYVDDTPNILVSLGLYAYRSGNSNNIYLRLIENGEVKNYNVKNNANVSDKVIQIM